MGRRSMWTASSQVSKSSGAYARTLRDLRIVGAEKEHSKQMFDIGQEESGGKFAVGHKALGLLSTFAQGRATQLEASEDIRGLGEEAYTETGAKKPWEELTPSEQSKFAPKQTYGETSFLDVLKKGTGEGGIFSKSGWKELGESAAVSLGYKQREYTMDEEVGGIKAGTYKQADLLTKTRIRKLEQLGLTSGAKSEIDDFGDENLYDRVYTNLGGVAGGSPLDLRDLKYYDKPSKGIEGAGKPGEIKEFGGVKEKYNEKTGTWQPHTALSSEDEDKDKDFDRWIDETGFEGDEDW